MSASITTSAGTTRPQGANRKRDRRFPMTKGDDITEMCVVALCC